MKTACIVQGDVRDGLSLILNELNKHFDYLILSTWEDDLDKIPQGNFYTLLNEKPICSGFSNRNLQRYSVSRGLDIAKKLGVDYVMKWRSDMLPTNFDINLLISSANYLPPKGMKSRIVTCAYRNLTVTEDWFSSIPDLFAFGHIEAMEMLWMDTEFDYSAMYNPPRAMFNLYRPFFECYNDYISSLWCAESELYSIFKYRLQNKLNSELCHENIVKNYFTLINHNCMRIVWFGNNSFRPFFQSLEHPWWDVDCWLGKSNIIYSEKGYLVNRFYYKVRKRFNYLHNLFQILSMKFFLIIYTNGIK